MVWTTVCWMVWPTVWTMVWTTAGLSSVRSAQWSGQCLVSLANGVQSLFSLANGGQSLLCLANTYLWVLSVWPMAVLGMVGLANTCLGSRTSSWVLKCLKFQYLNARKWTSCFPWSAAAFPVQIYSTSYCSRFDDHFLLFQLLSRMDGVLSRGRRLAFFLVSLVCSLMFLKKPWS